MKYLEKIKNLSELETNILVMAIYEFEKRGYHLANVDDIARKLKIGKGTIYRHFGNKQELFFYCLTYNFAERFKMLSLVDTIECPYEAINFSLDISFRSIEEMHGPKNRNDLLTQAIIVAKDEEELTKYMSSLIERSVTKVKFLLDKCVEKAGKKNIVDTTLVSEYIVATMGAFIHLHNSFSKYDTNIKTLSHQEFSSIKRFILRGIGINDNDINIVLEKSNNKIM